MAVFGPRNRMLSARRRPFTLPVVSANWLKNAGAVLTLIYFFGLTVIQNGILHASDYTSQEFGELINTDNNVFMLSGIATVCYLIGVAAIPIYAFLLVQGVLHTSNIKKYVLTVLIFAVISEVPYDLAVSGKAFNWEDQNVLFTVLIALIMLWLLKIFEGKGLGPKLLCFLIVAGGCFWAIVLGCKFGGGFVLIAAILFLLREKKGWSIIASLIISLIYATALFGFAPVALYSGERKNTDKKIGKYFYYAFYPAMLAVFAVIVAVL